MLESNKYWFVSLNEIQNEQGAKLRPARSKVLEKDRLIKEGEAFTISLESFYVKGNYDQDSSGNYLLVRSWMKYGNEPTAERVHFFQKDVPDEFIGENLPAEHILSKQDHSENNRLFISLDITEIDRGLKASSSINNTISTISGTFGAVFTSILPFAGVASDLVDLLDKLRNRKNISVFNSSLDLYAQDNFEYPLRYGAYVFFKEEVQGIMYRLLDLKLKPVSEQLWRQKPLHDYVVIKVVPGIIHSGDSSELLSNQQIASVLSQLDENGRNDESKRTEHFKFLQDTIKSANDMQELDYFYDLKLQQKLGKELSESEMQRYLEIAKKLQKYIPDL
mgnify:FL=1